MNTKLIPIIALIAAFLVGGCVSTSTIKQGHYGELPKNHLNIATAAVKSFLKDPYSAVVTEAAPPKKGWSKDGLIQGGAMHFGWVVTVSVNAKNSYGGYTGSQIWYILIEPSGQAYDITQLMRTMRNQMAGFTD